MSYGVFRRPFFRVPPPPQSPTLALLSTAEVATERSGEIRLSLSGYRSILGDIGPSRQAGALPLGRMLEVLSVVQRLRGDVAEAAGAQKKAAAAEASVRAEAAKRRRKAAKAQFDEEVAAEIAALEAQAAKRKAEIEAARSALRRQAAELASVEAKLQAQIAAAEAEAALRDEDEDLIAIMLAA